MDALGNMPGRMGNRMAHKTPLLLAVIVAALAFRPGGATALSDLAAQMKPGEWKEFKTQNLGNDTVLFANVNGQLYYGDLSATWSNYLAWNPGTEEIYWLGAPHLQPFNFLRYSAAQNRWYNETDVPDCMRIGEYKGCFNHGYDDGAIDAAKGIFYYHSGRQVFAYDIAKKSWSAWVQDDLADARASALEFFPPLGKLVYAIGPAATDGGLVQIIDPAAHTLETPSRELEMGDYNNTMEYSPPTRKLYFGGGGGSKAFYSMDSAKKIARLADAPDEYGCVRSSLAVDPVSGEPLIIANDNAFYAYSPSADAWRRLADPPARMNGADAAIAAMATGIAEYGVVFYLAPALKKAYLYKHASGGTAIRQDGLGSGADGRASGMRISPDPEGGLTVLLPEGWTSSGRVDILGLGGRRVAFLPAAARVHWLPGKEAPANGPLLVVWREGGKRMATRLAPYLVPGQER
jgi:hypothetical protein